MSMIKVTGPKSSIESLRDMLLEHPQATDVVVTVPEPENIEGEPIRVRQSLLAEAIFAFTVHVPAGMTAHFAYESLKDWLKKRADEAQVVVQEVAGKASSEPIEKAIPQDGSGSTAPETAGE